MLSFDDEKNSLADALDKYSVGVPPVQWLPWIPQLLACLVQYDGSVILNLLSHVSCSAKGSNHSGEQSMSGDMHSSLLATL